MGRKTSTETLAKLFVAFIEQGTWQQKALERRCNVTTRTLRRCLLDMQEAGIQLEREEDHPHVYWSVPKGWLPLRNSMIEGVDQEAIARLIARLPRSQTRERVLAELIRPALGDARTANRVDADFEDDILHVLEDGARRRLPIRMGYYTASRGEHGLRTVSVQGVAYGVRTRFVGHCHASETLKWFRADRVTSPRVDEKETFRVAAPDEVERFVTESLDGFHGGDGAQSCEFFVRVPESHWAIRNMPVGTGQVLVSHDADGAHVTAYTAALDVLARFVVGLGGAARVIAPPTLRARVRSLAQQSMLANAGKLNTGSARPIRPSRIAHRSGS